MARRIPAVLERPARRIGHRTRTRETTRLRTEQIFTIEFFRRRGLTMTEIASQDTSLTAVERSMGNREIAEGSARTAVLKRRYNASVDDVWDAITTPDRINRFFLPVSGDLDRKSTRLNSSH